MNNRAQTACFTGHRSIKEKDLLSLTQRLIETIANLTNKGILYWLNGGACGFDHLAAFAVLKARKVNLNIKLIMLLPCKNQNEHWNETDKQSYKYLLENADEVVYISEQPYFNGCMEKRNLSLVERSAVCVAYMNRRRSGTSQTVRMAQEHKLTVINLAEDNK